MKSAIHLARSCWFIDLGSAPLLMLLCVTASTHPDLCRVRAKAQGLMPTPLYTASLIWYQGQFSLVRHHRGVQIGDHFMIDSFVIGKQRLGCVGVRYLLDCRENA